MHDTNPQGGERTEPDDSGCVVATNSPCALAAISVPTAQLDKLFDILSSQRRRFVLFHLVRSDAAVVEREELAETVIACERSTGDGGPSPEKDSVVRDLHHHALPRLQEAGYIDYDPRHGTVRNDAPSQLATCLAVLQQIEEGESYEMGS